MKKTGIIAIALALVAITIMGGVALRHKPEVKSIARKMLIKAGMTSLDTAQSEKLPIHSKPSATPTPNAVYYRDGVIVLMYHEVTDTQTDSKTLLLSKFKEQLHLMKANGFHWITMSQYKDFILNHAKVPDNAVLMTFDDGYESFYQDAYPLLKQYHVPATNFVIVGTVDNPKHPGIAKLTWNQIKEMHRHGIDFFNHTFDSHSYAYTDAKHHDTKALLAGPVYQKNQGLESEEQFKARIYKDLLKAQTKLHEEVGNTYDVLAFPYGAFSEDTLKVCRDLGIQITFTVKRGMNHAGQINGYRVNAGGADNDPAVTVEYMKEGAPEPKRTLTLNKPYDLLSPVNKMKSKYALGPQPVPAQLKAAG